MDYHQAPFTSVVTVRRTYYSLFAVSISSSLFEPLNVSFKSTPLHWPAHYQLSFTQLLVPLENNFPLTPLVSLNQNSPDQIGIYWSRMVQAKTDLYRPDQTGPDWNRQDQTGINQKKQDQTGID